MGGDGRVKPDSEGKWDYLALERAGKTPKPQEIAYAFALVDQKLVADGKLTDCQALVAFASVMASVQSGASAFVQSFGVLIPQTTAGALAGIPQNSNSVSLNTGQQSGFVPLYQNTPNDQPGWNGDQGHHFAAFFAYGFLHPSSGLTAATFYEIGQALGNGSLDVNTGDIVLGALAAELGRELAVGQITPQQVSAMIAPICKK